MLKKTDEGESEARVHGFVEQIDQCTLGHQEGLHSRIARHATPFKVIAPANMECEADDFQPKATIVRVLIGEHIYMLHQLRAIDWI